MRSSAAIVLALLLAVACAGKGHTNSPDAKKVNSGAAGTKPVPSGTSSSASK